MKKLYICDTPYQVFNVLNIVYSEEQTQIQHGVIRHLFIINQFDTATLLTERIKAKRIFNDVYLLTRDETKFLPVGVRRNVKMALDFLNPTRFMCKRLGLEQLHQIGNIKDTYDLIYASGAFSTVAAMMKLNPTAAFIMYDDGLGSYSGDYIVRSSGGKANLFFCKLFHVGSDVCKPKKLLVNNLSLCKSTSVNSADIMGLPKINDDFMRFSREIFQNGDAEDRFDLIWLTQPLDNTAGAREVREKVKEGLLNYQSIVGVRMHPRDLDIDFYSNFAICDNRNLWELYFLSKDIDKLVLVSYYSSAQFTPKLLFNLEPILIFTYKINKNISEQDMLSFDSAIQDLKRIYKSPNRIKIPESVAELVQILDSIVQSKKE